MRGLLLLLAVTSSLAAAIQVQETAKLPADGGWYDSGSRVLGFA